MASGLKWLVASVALSSLFLGGSHAFIRVQSGLFVDDQCKEFTFSGYNTWQPIEAALNICCGGYTALVGQFKEAARQNFNVVRMFGFPVQRGFNLQTSAGVYNEQAFKGFDITIAEAAKQNIRLVIALTNNWNYNPLQTDWKCAYTNWTTTATDCDDFFTDPNAIQLYKNHIRTILTRVNTVTGIKYGADPTIMAWNLMNEPRNERPYPLGAQQIQSWINEVAPYLKSLAPNQLVTVGEDGFYQTANCQSNQANPVPNSNGGAGGAWPLNTGNDFLPNHLANGIDYGSIHMWPDNWGRTDLGFGKAWLQAHIDDVKYMGKPLVLEEFGKAVGGYLPVDKAEGPQAQYNYYQQTYSQAQQSLDSNTGLKGIMFWRWAGVDPTVVLSGTDFNEAATIASNSTVFTDILQPFSQRLAQKNANPNRAAVPGCQVLSNVPTLSASKSAAVAATPPTAAVPPVSANTAAGSGSTPTGNAGSSYTGAAAGGRKLRQDAAAAPTQAPPIATPTNNAPATQANAPPTKTAASSATPGAPPTSYAGPSTFTTPAGTTAQNVNSKVQCSG
ncbi:g7095 [Coccomyxa viridis]|uniref:mannan endo-1,4-beta-mannosidase n=1 Tax=Coccomyxa viridis TaxID=1274662 RepID=A0ABP1G1V0_9CHLO